MGSDQERKLAVAKTRYMDKQSVAQFHLKEPTSAAGNPEVYNQLKQKQFLQMSSALKSSACNSTPALNKDSLNNYNEIQKPQLMLKKAGQDSSKTSDGLETFDLQNSVKQSCTKEQESGESGDLATQIQRDILKLVTKSSKCECDCANSQINAKLLQYFFDNEFQKKQTKVIEKQTQVSPQKHDSCQKNIGVSDKTHKFEIDSVVDHFEKDSSKTSAQSIKKEEQSYEATVIENTREDRGSIGHELSNDQVSSKHCKDSSDINILDKVTPGNQQTLDGCKPVSQTEKQVCTDQQSANSDCIDLQDFQRHQAKPVTQCPHKDRKHYAKNMCSSCYRRFGRNQNATKCGHNDRLLYSMGMCQTCYMADYHQRRTKPMKKIIQKQLQKQGLFKDKQLTDPVMSPKNADIPQVIQEQK